MRTVGTIRLLAEGRPWRKTGDRPHWEIKCEPYVRVRLKRMFERAHKGEHDAMFLADSPEVARELAWFTDRFPMEVTPRDYLDARAAEQRQCEAKVQSILTGRYQMPLGDLAVPARPYQRTAAELLLSTGRLLLADDLGLGKTCSAIATLTDSRTLPALVVTLTHLPAQWERELARFAPHLRSHVLRGARPYALDKTARGKLEAFPDVIISNYHKLSGWADVLAPVVRSVIFDEVQELRGGDSNKYRAARHIAGAASFRMGLSGTPFYNYGGELFFVFDALAPDALGTREEFVREWCEGGDAKPRVREPAQLGSYLRDQGLMLRRTRSEVGRELPALNKVPHQIEADLATIDKVSGSAAELAKIILTKGEGREKGAAFRASEELSNILRQATGLAKAPYVAAFVRLLIENGEKVVLYGWHRGVYALWQQLFEDLKPAFYTGAESTTQKAESVRRFVEGETPLLILSLRAGAGLDGLQKVCRTVVFGELDWSPGVHEQNCGRVYRDGQAEPVVAYFLIADHGSDPTVAEVLGLKKAQIEGLRDPNAEVLAESIDPNHMRSLAEAFLKQQGARKPVMNGQQSLPVTARGATS